MCAKRLSLAQIEPDATVCVLLAGELHSRTSDRLAVRGAKPFAREHGGRGRCVAVVEPLASCSPQPCGLGGRRPGGASPALASARASPSDRGGADGAKAFGGAWFAFRRHRLATARREAVSPRIDASPPRPPLALCIRIRVTTPPPESGVLHPPSRNLGAWPRPVRRVVGPVLPSEWP